MGYLPAALTPETQTLDTWAKASGISRSEAIRRLVETGLNEGQAIMKTVNVVFNRNCF